MMEHNNQQYITGQDSRGGSKGGGWGRGPTFKSLAPCAPK